MRGHPLCLMSRLVDPRVAKNPHGGSPRRAETRRIVPRTARLVFPYTDRFEALGGGERRRQQEPDPEAPGPLHGRCEGRGRSDNNRREGLLDRLRGERDILVAKMLPFEGEALAGES